MDLAEKAVVLRNRKKIVESTAAFSDAFLLEAWAAMQLKYSFELEPSRSILFSSAASLAVNAGIFDRAKQMIELGLSGNPPAAIATELRDLEGQIKREDGDA